MCVLRFRIYSSQVVVVSLQEDEEEYIDFELDEELLQTKIPNKCSVEDLKEALRKRKNY